MDYGNQNQKDKEISQKKDIRSDRRKKKKVKHYNTDVYYVDFENEQFIVREKNLCDLIKGADFIETIFHTLLNKSLTEKEKKIMNAVLVSFHGGVEIYAPTVLSARISISTGTDIPTAMAAANCASGKYHTGAIEKSMLLYEEIYKGFKDEGKKEYEDDLEGYTRKTIEHKLQNNETLFGFGHPLFNKDPRPEALRSLAKELDYHSDYLKMYDTIKDKIYETKKIYPNIDGINGAMLLSLGYTHEYGTPFFLFARTIGVLAHVIEEKNREPWDIWKQVFDR